MNSLKRRAALRGLAVGALVPLVLSPERGIAQTATTTSQGKLNRAALDEILSLSQSQKRGLSVLISGQTISGVFVARLDENTLELRSVQFGRIIVRVDRIDAIALN